MLFLFCSHATTRKVTRRAAKAVWYPGRDSNPQAV